MDSYSLATWSNKSDIVTQQSLPLDALVKQAVQLSKKEQRQIIEGFNAKHYDLVFNYLWMKTINVLKSELATVGIPLLAEMLGRVGVSNNATVDDFLTNSDVIALAGELGILTKVQTLRLRQTHDMLSLFSSLDSEEHDYERIEDSEAESILNYCVRYVLGHPKIEVAQNFVDFRDALKKESLTATDNRVQLLRDSPYFFHKLAINVLLGIIKKEKGAQLEHALSNINLLLPILWEKLHDTEKWQVGYAYAEVYNEGKNSAVSGLKKALLKVRGFDFVPENLRSNTFIKAAQEIFAAHDSMDNFYNESAPVKKLASLGSIIPPPAIASCVSALLSVVLGNIYGRSWTAAPDAEKLLNNLGEERWTFYINNVLPQDTRTLTNIQNQKPFGNWADLVLNFSFNKLEIKDKKISLLIQQSHDKNFGSATKVAQELIADYYGDK